MRLHQPIKEYKILIETTASHLDGKGWKKLKFTGTKAEAQNHLATYIESHRITAYKAYLQEVL